MAVERCLHDKSFYNAEWKEEIKNDFLIFAKRFVDENIKDDLSYSDLEEFYINHLKSTGCFDWENDDKDLEEDEECDGTYEDEIYNLLDDIEMDCIKLLNYREES